MAYARKGLKQQSECPDCGHAYARYLDKVWANDGAIPVRRYTCPAGCGTYMTAEVPIPKGQTSMMGLDEKYRTWRRDYERKRIGYWGTATRGGTIIGADRLLAVLRVVRAPRKGDKVAA